MKRIASLVVLVSALVALAVPAFAQEPPPVSLTAFVARTQVGIGFQREWLDNKGSELLSPKTSWVAVIPASFNVTPSVDVIGQVSYNLTVKSVRYVLGVRFVVLGRK